MNGNLPHSQVADPSPEEVLTGLASIMPILWEAIESATSTATMFFLDQQKVIDASLYPNLVRYYAKQFLANHNIDAHDESAMGNTGTEDIQSIDLANNGLCIIAGRYAIRVRKSDHGQIPLPGKSQAMQNFYRQDPLPFNLIHGPTQLVDIALLLLWDIDYQHHFAGFTLVRPRDGSTTRKSLDLYWLVPVPNPLVIATPSETPAEADELEEITIIEDPKQHRRQG